MTRVYSSEFIQNALRHVYWIGGSPCSGKSSIADSLAQSHDMQLYRCDDAFWKHTAIITPEKQPVFHRVMHLSPDNLWMRPVEQQTAEELEIYREEFALILDDLLSLPNSRPVLAEGAALLPELILPLLDGPSRAYCPSRAVWMVPTPEFQWEHYRGRGWWREVLKDCADPEQAFRNWMGRDAAFARFVAGEVAKSGLRLLTVDGQSTLAENLSFIEAHFQINHFMDSA